MGVFDHDLWQAREPVRRTCSTWTAGLWLEVLVRPAPSSLPAGRRDGLDLVTAAFSRYLLVLDAEWNATERRDAALLDVDAGLAEQLALAEATPRTASSSAGSASSRRGAPWDVEILARLSSDHPAPFGQLMVRCGALLDGVHRGQRRPLRRPDERRAGPGCPGADERRARRATWPPEVGLPKLARQPSAALPRRDPLTTRYFRTLDARASASRKADATPPMSVPGTSPRVVASSRCSRKRASSCIAASTLPAGEKDAPDRRACRAAALRARARRRRYARGRTSSAISPRPHRRLPFQSRRFRPVEATDAVPAVCNLGLENRPHAWTVLRRVPVIGSSSPSSGGDGASCTNGRFSDPARRLVRALAALRVDDLEPSTISRSWIRWRPS